MKHDWNFVSRFSVLCAAAFLSSVVFATTVVIIDDSVDPVAAEKDQQTTIARMKYRVVAEYAQKLLGNRFAQVEPAITPEVVDRFIRSYHLGRAPGNRLQIEVDFDMDGVRGWVNLSDKSREGRALKPVLVVESLVGGMTLEAGDTGGSSRENPFVQTLLQLTNASLQKFNVVAFLPRGGLSVSHRPRTESEIRSLGSQSSLNGANSVIWIQLSPCKDCGGTRVDLSLFNFVQNRASLNLVQELPLEPGALAQPERAKTALKPLMQDFQTQLEQLLSKDIIFSSIYRLAIEGLVPTGGLKNYQAARSLGPSLEKLDFIGKAALKVADARYVQLEIYTSLKPNEALQSLEEARFNGFRLKAVRVDSQTLVMRYLK